MQKYETLLVFKMDHRKPERVRKFYNPTVDSIYVNELLWCFEDYTQMNVPKFCVKKILFQG